MKRLILGIYVFLFSIWSWAAIQVQLEPSHIMLGETFDLILTQEGQFAGVPALNVLQKDYVILSTERHINYSMLNGQSKTFSQWIIKLKPMRSGILTIPPIAFGTQQSPAVTINVEQNGNAQGSGDAASQQAVILMTEVNEKKPYINQQIIYTVKLLSSKRLLDAQYQGPQVDNALLFPLGEAKRYEIVKNNITYGVDEQAYAIYPQKSGHLTIRSPVFNALVYDLDPQQVKVQDNDIHLEVQEIPKEYDNIKTWLPAKKLQLNDQYENTAQTLTQGSTLTRTIKIEGISVPAQLLPKLEFSSSDRFSVYPEKGVEHNEIKQGELTGSTEFKVTYLFNQAGKVVIPELKVHWFNITTDKEEVAILPPRSLEIIPTPTKIDSSNDQDKSLNTSFKSKSKIQEDTITSNKTSASWLSWFLLTFFACAWIVTLILWHWQKRMAVTGKAVSKKTKANLHRACEENNPHQARDALIKWANQYWPDAYFYNLNELLPFVDDARLKKQIHLLSEALYKKDDGYWNGSELYRVINELSSVTPKKRKQPKLPPLYPQ